MAFEPIYETARIESLNRLCSSQAVVEARLLPNSAAIISKVLSIATDCTVSPSEVFAGEARFNGKVSFKVVFIDGEGNNHSMDYIADFTDKLSCDAIRAGLKPMLSSSILDTDIVSVDERELKLACVVEVNLDAVVVESPTLLIKGGEDIYTHDDSIEFSQLVCETSDIFTVADSLTDVNCVGILLAEPKIIITSRNSGADGLLVEGKIVCDITAESDDGMIVSYSKVTEFSQEIAAHDAREDNLVVARASLSSFKAVFEASDNSSSILLEYSVSVTAKVFSDATLNPIVDAFSVKNELLQSGESLKILKNKLNSTLFERVEGSVTLDINMPIADNVLAVTGSKLHIASVNAADSKATFEGIVSCNIIYYCAEGNSKNSLAVELPFSITSNLNVHSGDIINASGIVEAITTKIRRGNEIDIKADILIELLSSCIENKFIITELKLGEERALPTSAFSIHIAKNGETLWDVAKSLGTTPEIVLVQNPNLTLPLLGGERVIAYRRLT